MRKTWLIVMMLSASAVLGPAWALQPSDTMTAWRTASQDEKSALVAALLKREGREGGAADVVTCLDTASGIAGHADLPISELVKVCAKKGGEPV